MNSILYLRPFKYRRFWLNVPIAVNVLPLLTKKAHYRLAECNSCFCKENLVAIFLATHLSNIKISDHPLLQSSPSALLI